MQAKKIRFGFNYRKFRLFYQQTLANILMGVLSLSYVFGVSGLIILHLSFNAYLITTGIFFILLIALSGSISQEYSIDKSIPLC